MKSPAYRDDEGSLGLSVHEDESTASASHEARLEAEADAFAEMTDEEFDAWVRDKHRAWAGFLEAETAELTYEPERAFKWKRGA